MRDRDILECACEGEAVTTHLHFAYVDRVWKGG